MRRILDRDSKRPFGINVERLLDLSRFSWQGSRIAEERGSTVRVGACGLRDDAVGTRGDESVGAGGADAFGLGVVLGLTAKNQSTLDRRR
jgi:hypothetical protein